MSRTTHHCSKTLKSYPLNRLHCTHTQGTRYYLDLVSVVKNVFEAIFARRPWNKTVMMEIRKSAKSEGCFRAQSKKWSLEGAELLHPGDVAQTWGA
eukprot:6001583-Amphidinium_carterae.1